MQVRSMAWCLSGPRVGQSVNVISESGARGGAALLRNKESVAVHPLTRRSTSARVTSRPLPARRGYNLACFSLNDSERSRRGIHIAIFIPCFRRHRHHGLAQIVPSLRLGRCPSTSVLGHGVNCVALRLQDPFRVFRRLYPLPLAGAACGQAFWRV